MRTLSFLITLYLIPYTSIPSYSQDFEVAPVKMLYDCEPGQIQTKILYVRNHANQKQQFNILVAEMPADSAGKKKKVIEIDGKQHLEYNYHERDKYKDKVLRKNGWKILRIKFVNLLKNPKYWYHRADLFIGP